MAVMVWKPLLGLGFGSVTHYYIEYEKWFLGAISCLSRLKNEQLSVGRTVIFQT